MEQSLTDAIQVVPRPFDPDVGADASAGLPSRLAPLVSGAAGTCPHIRQLVDQERDWLIASAERPAEAVFEAILDGLPEEEAAQKLGVALREAKRRVALLTALADLGGIWSLEEVTGALTTFADRSLDLAIRAYERVDVAKGAFPGRAHGDPTGLFALAMGKMGAGELNYSSDIDLIALIDTRDYGDPAVGAEARSAAVRVVRRAAKLLSERTAGGYVWRVDLRLRPDPSVTPVAVTTQAAEAYYERLGRTWERAAHIKARVAAGDAEAGQAYLDRLQPFVWRRHLDFATVGEAEDMRQAIRDHRGLHDADSLEGRNLKLGPGGIREIEFFAQTRQLIAGGRDPSLRVRGTVEALSRLSASGWISASMADALTGHYRLLRSWEHRVQMINDAQTHALPGDAEGFERLACLTGDPDGQTLKGRVSECLHAVQAETDAFYAAAGGSTAGSGAEERAEPPDLDPLAPPDEPEIVARWRSYPALRSARAVEIYERLKPDLLARLMAAPRPEEALNAFDGFLAGLPAGVQLFALFEANPRLRALIVDIAASAPALARYLSRNSGVLDAVIGGDFFAPWPGRAELEAELSGRLASEPDYEARLDALRRWGKEWHFRVGVHFLRRMIDWREAGFQYAELAEASIGAILPHVAAEVGRRHGPPPGRGAAVVAMGALGAGWLTARSDLDLILIYDAGGAAQSEGKRPLAPGTYFSKFSQALVTALTAPTAAGRLYEVDLRLRPSGRQGPVAVSLSGFESYQREKAWTWEHLALTRARAIAGDADLLEDIEAVRTSVLSSPRDTEKTLADLRHMRARLRDAKVPEGPLDTKAGAGRLLDIDLAAQASVLLSGRLERMTADQLRASSQMDAPLFDVHAAEELIEAHRLQTQVQAVARLVSEGALRADEIGEGALQLLLDTTGQNDLADLQSALAEARTRADDHITKALADPDHPPSSPPRTTIGEAP